MPDIVAPHVRSRMMSGIRGKNTKPELLLRKGLHARGFRFRLHDSALPGKPDIVFPVYRAVIFAHGCFWHGHDCHLFRWPKSREKFWHDKINRNKFVDRDTASALSTAGWRRGVVWECALKGKTRIPLIEVIELCENWLRSDAASLEIRGGVCE
nr:very short patch repair endonuclease [Bosea sp. CRIB-10]